ncbi:dynein heavy chain family protein [Cryptosporidium muris RN66]|uniref:Dynein heavy chain family protein n=1 Tax=Cryptosporidium muris (strain RN66) TaxID=441375 RepID=B6AGN3_CRYMR|nr:dynein heavy chain family protein [Cryptosporidium muris RN66]EEA07374.1 dynein heavy chain family protein [Cryptosporidium muris RN66]|eukprot:XP_002141723.1 dynein heavy chain family protein [Cryptosporidium muris RN66]
MSQRIKTALINFLLEVVPSVLDCSRQQLTSLLTSHGDDSLKRFLRDTDIHCLIVGKEPVEGNPAQGVELSDNQEEVSRSLSSDGSGLEYGNTWSQYELFIETSMTARCLKASLMVFVKNLGFAVSEDGIITTSADRDHGNLSESLKRDDDRKHTPIKSTRTIASSLQCIQLGFVDSKFTPYEVLNQYLQYAFTPLLGVLGNVKNSSSLNDSTEGIDGVDSNLTNISGSSGAYLGLDNIQRKVNELCIALQQGQDDSMVPMVRLVLDSRVYEYAKEYKNSGRQINMDGIADDQTFLSGLQMSLTQWIRDIQSLARFQRDIGLSVTSEVKFWSSYERSLQQIMQQIQSVEVEWSLAVLRQTKKFLAAISLEVDTGLKQTLERVQSVNSLIHDLPINDLLVASTVDEIISAVHLFFQHIRKIKAVAAYPISRVFQLVEVYSADMTRQLYKVLQNTPSKVSLMNLEYPLFEHLVNGCNELAQTWEDEWRLLKEIIRDLIKKRGLSERAHPKLDFNHIPLIQRLNDIVAFRKQHQKLKDTLVELLTSRSGDTRNETTASTRGGMDMLQTLAKKDLEQAYACVANINILDLSSIGLETWEAGKQAYNNKMDASETLLIKQLREQLNNASNTLDMFHILGRYNVLFFRPRIRNAVEEYQNILLEKVEADFKLLQTRYQNPYQSNAASQFSYLRDIPNVGGTLIWSHLLQDRIQNIYQKLESIFGSNWEFEAQGHKVKSDGDQITSKIHPSKIVDYWLQRRKDDKVTYDLNKPVFGLQKNYNATISNSILVTTIDPNILSLFKDLRIIQSYSYRVPYSVKVLSDELKLLYPYITRLNSLCMNWMRISTFLEMEPGKRISPLLTPYRNDVYNVIQDGLTLKWSSDHLDAFIGKFNDSVDILEARFETVLAIDEELSTLIDQIQNIPIYNGFDELVKHMNKIYSISDSLQELLLAYRIDYLFYWDQVIQSYLLPKLKGFITLWIQQFAGLQISGGPTVSSNTGGNLSTGNNLTIPTSSNLLLDLPQTVITLQLVDQKITLNPSLDDLKSYWLQRFHQALAQLTSLRRIIDVVSISPNSPFAQQLKIGLKKMEVASNIEELKSAVQSPVVKSDSTTISDTVHPWVSSTDIGAVEKVPIDNTYRHLILLLPESLIEWSYETLDHLFVSVDNSIDHWRQFEALWTVELNSVTNQLINLSQWQLLLRDMRNLRSTFNMSDDLKWFSPKIGLEVSSVQAKITNKYDSLAREVLHLYATKLNEQLSNYWTSINSIKLMLNKLEPFLPEWLSWIDKNSSNLFSITLNTNQILAEGSIMVNLPNNGNSLHSTLVELSSKIISAQEFDAKLGSDLPLLLDGQKFLEVQRFTFPNDWIWAEQFEGEYENTHQRLDHCFSIVIQPNRRKIETYLKMTVQLVFQTYQNLLNEWTQLRSITFVKDPSIILDQITLIEKKVNTVHKDVDSYRLIFRAFKFDSNWIDSELKKITGDTFEVAIKDFKDFKDIWSQLNIFFTTINGLKSTLWVSVNPKTLKSNLEELLTNIKSIPIKYRQYDAFDQLEMDVKDYMKYMLYITKLKVDFFKERHWRILLSKVKWQDKKTRVSVLDGSFKATRGVQGASGKSILTSAPSNISVDSSISIVSPGSASGNKIIALSSSNSSSILSASILSTLTLGDVWSIDFDTSGAVITEIIIKAQGEHTLETYLLNIKEIWTSLEVEFTTLPSNASIKVVKNWDVILSLIDDHLSALQNMALSPYYEIFREESQTWVEKLTRLRSIIDLWMETQRRWIYLQGIFIASTDIANLLPQEYNRFHTVDHEVQVILKRSLSKPKVLDILSFEGLVKSLERVSDYLNKIQKALGEYLEKQRSMFPRFYFIGDEDLLEMIGNGKDVTVAQRHFSKIFAGISYLEFSIKGSENNMETNSDNSAFKQFRVIECIITGMFSKEGEKISFKKPINIYSDTSLVDWLNNVVVAMQDTLKDLMRQAVSEISQEFPCPIKDENETLNMKLSKIFSKFPAQVLLVAWITWWTQRTEESFVLKSTKQLLEMIQAILSALTNIVSKFDESNSEKTKYNEMIVEFVHQRDVLIYLSSVGVDSPQSFHWLQYMRMYSRRIEGLDSTSTDKKSLANTLINYDNSNSNDTSSNSLIVVSISNATFLYGYEYLGIPEKLVQTPLTDRTYLTLTQALDMRLGGNPFGPAGTGKTETVKALGNQMGRFVLVFNCDERFDFTAMGRIFVGLCQVGAWGCFDEFNRLQARILSAVSEQILTIQTALSRQSNTVELLNKVVPMSPDVGIFVTMNPGYAGRSELPDNLKHLLREIAMVIPDKQRIAEVTLFAQGFQYGNIISKQIVTLFELCQSQMSNQPHYDFGLRSMKSVLKSAGKLKRRQLGGIPDLETCNSEMGTMDKKNILPNDHQSDDKTSNILKSEQQLIIRSISSTLLPKLIARDIPLLSTLFQGVFPSVSTESVHDLVMEEQICNFCYQNSLEPSPRWMDKALQLYEIQKLNHGVMLVGSTGTGKSSIRQILLDAMDAVEGCKSSVFVIDPKTIDKESLFGKLNPVTLEWTDGIFTALLRKIISSGDTMGAGGTASSIIPLTTPSTLIDSSTSPNKRYWIVFDGDVDPEWAENLNSVLDDNKILTLPNGERLELPNCVRIIFEVHTLATATLATVSRCGMIWFSEDIITDEMYFKSYLYKTIKTVLNNKILSSPPSALGISGVPGSISEVGYSSTATSAVNSLSLSNGDQVQEMDIETLVRNKAFTIWSSLLIGTKKGDSDGNTGASTFFGSKCLTLASNFPHVMTFTRIRVIGNMFSLLNYGVKLILEQYESNNTGFDISSSTLFFNNWLIWSIIWGFSSSMNLADRIAYTRELAKLVTFTDLPQDLVNNEDIDTSLLDYGVLVHSGSWQRWSHDLDKKVVEVSLSQVLDSSIIIETVDTLRHYHILHAWINGHLPAILCGPPGSGKTMTLSSVLRNMSDVDVVSLNFSSATTPEILIKTLDHYCEFVKAPKGWICRPVVPNKWLVVFCDECNLPEPDQYGTQRVIMFIRQLVESHGYWKKDGSQWNFVTLERIQFVGACNPPTDTGRHPLSDRFLRHSPVLFVDFPGTKSLKQIYSVFNRAILKPFPTLYEHSEALTSLMVDIYDLSEKTLTVDLQSHYIYSPRDLTRWKISLYSGIHGKGQTSLTEKVSANESHGDSYSSISYSSLSPNLIEQIKELKSKNQEFDLRYLLRLVLYEGERIFQDRLVEESEREWSQKMMNSLIIKYFPNISKEDLKRPLLFTSLVTSVCQEVPRSTICEFLQEKLCAFYEEQGFSRLVLFDEFLDNINRVDRVLRQPFGHLLLIGPPGCGKTLLANLVSWLNGLHVFTIKPGRKYDIFAFEADLRLVMKRAAIKGEKLTFIFEESHALGPAFIERMNALLASGEVPGLFQGDEYTQLLNECRAAYGASVSISVDESNELFLKFTKLVQENLHIVFTLNPANPNFKETQSLSPALFNRCIVNWMGRLTNSALNQIARSFLNFGPNSESNLGDTALPTLTDTDVTPETSIIDIDPSILTIERIPTSCMPSIENNEDRISAITQCIVDLFLAELDKFNNQSSISSHRKKNPSYHSTVLNLSHQVSQRTPRDFFDFLKHILKLYKEKNDSLLEQQQHLSSGLETLHSTEIQVANLQKDLGEKEQTLIKKNSEAEQKMLLMVKEQGEAEDKKKTTEVLAKSLDEQQVVIAERSNEVENQLKVVEPILREAKNAVSNIPKKNLDELRSMANPPSLVKMTIDAVAILLTNNFNKPQVWEESRKVLKSADFISRVINFDSTAVTSKTIQRLHKEYLDTPEWDTEKINRASHAAGPLSSWVSSILEFSTINEKVGPLKQEISNLEKSKVENEQNLAAAQKLLKELQERIDTYKKEYAELISEVQSIKREKELVTNKVERSIKLLGNLTTEQDRWRKTKEGFQTELSNIMGDCLLASAFICFAGGLDQIQRSQMISIWRGIMDDYHLSHTKATNFKIIDFLSKPSERLIWQSFNLSNDDLSVENAIILKRHIRYPLIIDPSGHATSFLAEFSNAGGFKGIAGSTSGTGKSAKTSVTTSGSGTRFGSSSGTSNVTLRQSAASKLQSTTFRDPNFPKLLESALRFGSSLIIQDITSSLDPLIYNVLNQETHNHGGRTLITVGDNDVDFSPQFNMYLTTQDPTIQFGPDITSRVTMVNFTVTPSSLFEQCRNLILKHLRPDIDKKRSDLLKLHGEYRVQLRECEDNLLLALSNVHGNILEDENIINTLEVLKKKAQDIQTETLKMESTMQHIDQVLSHYLPLSLIATRIFFTLQHLPAICSFYQFDLNFFYRILFTILEKGEVVNKKSTSEVIENPEETSIIEDFELDISSQKEIILRLLKEAFDRVSQGLLYNDRMVLGVHLLRIYIESFYKVSLDETLGKEIDILTKVFGILSTSSKKNSDLGTEEEKKTLKDDSIMSEIPKSLPLDRDQIRQLNHIISFLPSFSNIPKSMNENTSQWIQLLNSNEPEVFLNSNFKDLWPVESKSDEHLVSTVQLFKEGILNCLLLKLIRPDRLLMAFNILISSILGPSFTQSHELTKDVLNNIVNSQVNESTPILFVTSPGFDSSQIVTQVAKENNVKITSIAIGSSESAMKADETITKAIQQGTWVLLKNIHLSTGSLDKLEQQLQNRQSAPNKNFRLFMSTELPKHQIYGKKSINDASFNTCANSNKESALGVPLNLIRVSTTIVLESPVGLKAALQRANTITIRCLEGEQQSDDALLNTSIKQSAPLLVIKLRLYFLVAFLHAVILERKRYSPLGWTKFYNFSEADLQCSLSIINTWVTEIQMNDPEQIPWGAIRELIYQVSYGGRLDNVVDKQILQILISEILSSKSFEDNFQLISSTSNWSKLYKSEKLALTNLIAPDTAKNPQVYLDWIENLPSTNLPTWLGLSPLAENVILAQKGLLMSTNWHKLIVKARNETPDLLPNSQILFGNSQDVSQQNYLNYDESSFDINLSEESEISRDLSESELENSFTSQPTTGLPSWLFGVQDKLENILKHLLPFSKCILEIIPKLTAESQQVDAISRFYISEFRSCLSGYKQIWQDIQELKSVFNGISKLTNNLRGIGLDLQSDLVPSVWFDLFPLPASSIDLWIADLSKRLAQYCILVYQLRSKIPLKSGDINAIDEIKNTGDANLELFSSIVLTITPAIKCIEMKAVWLGGFYDPEAFFTASKQYAAKLLDCSLNDVVPKVTVFDDNYSASESNSECSFTIGGITATAIEWNSVSRIFELSVNRATYEIPPIRLEWVKQSENNFIYSDKIDDNEYQLNLLPQNPLDDTISIPVYKDSFRDEILIWLSVPANKGENIQQWRLAGTSLILWKE